ncbi:uncharacterized protein LOC126840333 [Adelges cooleyi]|uniref:uncharacterized protein LOC126840333 n=1 Tax=Adelges cooleyi TaxID=133065 RepID=UPI00217FD370|nr:uncharacterized protein LOC126840333 [Adelges cooleyi]
MNCKLVVLVAAVLVAASGFALASPVKERPGEDDEVAMTAVAQDGGDGGGGNNRVTAAQRHRTEEATAADEPERPTKTSKSAAHKQHNAKLLNRLGMKRVRTNENHHRKRLASQSRSKYAANSKGGMDSQMFMVKLPPHAYFYDESQQFRQHYSPNGGGANVNTLPVGFVSNGKPAKVYHWNLPTVKKALQGRYKSNDVLYADFEPSASKIVPRRTLYYKPKAAGKPVKKSFVNNGKPNGFYVVSRNSGAVQPPQYHKIVKTYYGNDD